MIADRQAGQDRRCDEPAVGAARIDAARPLPAHQQPEQARQQREVQRVRVGVGADRPDDRRGREPDPGDDTEDRRARQAAGRGRRSSRPRPRRGSRTGGSSGTRPRRAARARSRPASRGARTSDSRSGGPCRGSAGPSGTPRCPRSRRRASAARRRAHAAMSPTPIGADRGDATGRGGDHHPSRLPQMTPQALIAIDDHHERRDDARRRSATGSAPCRSRRAGAPTARSRG